MEDEKEVIAFLQRPLGDRRNACGLPVSARMFAQADAPVDDVFVVAPTNPSFLNPALSVCCSEVFFTQTFQSSEDSTHQLIDNIMKNLMVAVLPSIRKLPLKFARNQQDLSDFTRKNKRPDVILSLHGIPVMKGEEKRPAQHLGVAVAELTSKLEIMDPLYSDGLHFQLGYATGDGCIQYFLIAMAPRTATPFTDALSLTSVRDKSLVVRAVVNCYRYILFRYQHRQYSMAPIPHPRTVEGTEVLVDYDEVQKSTRHYTQGVLELYKSLHRQPHHNVMTCVSAKGVVSVKRRCLVLKLRLRPIGIERQPNRDEVKLCLGNCLAGLDHIHTILNWMHCDLRWKNVLYTPRPPHWFIIDLDFARQCGKAYEGPTLHEPHENPANFPPEISRGEMWSTASDVYQLGVMFRSLPFELPAAINDIVALMVHQDPRQRPSANSLLDMLERIND